jgi:hypothetical protein
VSPRYSVSEPGVASVPRVRLALAMRGRAVPPGAGSGRVNVVVDMQPHLLCLNELGHLGIWQK